jgi:arylsulfatase A-like enzyme
VFLSNFRSFLAARRRCPRPLAAWPLLAGLALLAAMGRGGMAADGDGSGSAGAPGGRPRPNVVLIVSDDQHWGDYAFMGHPHLRTPHLDRLARESLLYRHGYVPSSLCCPSLASLITGRFPHEHRLVGNDPPGSERLAGNSPEGQRLFQEGREAMNRHLAEWPTLPALLAPHGYRSLQTGKWWQGNFSRGGFTAGMTRGDRHGDDGLAIGRETLEPIETFIDDCQEEGAPFLVWYAPMLPHDPHDPPTDLVDHYRTVAPSLHVARYWGNVERFDRTVGQLLALLDAKGIAENTLVVFVTDNGWIQSPDHPRSAPRSKGSPYDGGVRTPIMVRQPGRIEPGVSDVPVSSLDILPTILAACDVAAPAGLPGVDLLDPRAVASRGGVFGECYTHTLVDLDVPARSLLWRWTVQGSWKLVVPERLAADDPRWEVEGAALDDDSRAWLEAGTPRLFDLAADSGENRDMAAEHPDVVNDLRKTLDAWWMPGPPQSGAFSP